MGDLTMNSWELVFLQSKVNNGFYDGDRLPTQIWQWPEQTWFQTRRRYLRSGNRKYSEELTEQDLQ
jgi:hypothetical protein